MAKAIPVKHIVLTGVYFDDKELGAAVYDAAADDVCYVLGKNIPGSRSEERRVGEEWRSRGGADQLKKKQKAER